MPAKKRPLKGSAEHVVSSIPGARRPQLPPADDFTKPEERSVGSGQKESGGDSCVEAGEEKVKGKQKPKKQKTDPDECSQASQESVFVVCSKCNKPFKTRGGYEYHRKMVTCDAVKLPLRVPLPKPTKVGPQ